MNKINTNTSKRKTWISQIPPQHCTSMLQEAMLGKGAKEAMEEQEAQVEMAQMQQNQVLEVMEGQEVMVSPLNS